MNREKKDFLVSIIIPVYNLENYFEACIKTCLNQTFNNIEIIIINDGSTDNSLDLIKKYTLKDHRIKASSILNSGVAKAREAGLKLAKGDYLFFLDGDDYLPEDAIENLVRRAEETDADIVDGNYAFVDEAGNIEHKRVYSFDILKKDDYLITIFKCRQIYLCFKLIRRYLFSNIETPSGLTLGEDAVWFVQLVNNAERIAKCDDIIYYYFKRKQSVTISPKPYDLKMSYKASEWIYNFLSTQNTNQALDLELKRYKILHIILYLRRLNITGKFRDEIRPTVSLCFNKYSRKDLGINLFEYLVIKSSTVSVYLASFLINARDRIKRVLYLVAKPFLAMLRHN